ncbi:hypothetical protein RSK60_460001 [Ralstonia solanacearum K60]|nr:hypothetical protein RSK60_460001 [Ralstonia solanacearum K60]
MKGLPSVPASAKKLRCFSKLAKSHLRVPPGDVEEQ